MQDGAIVHLTEDGMQNCDDVHACFNISKKVEVFLIGDKIWSIRGSLFLLK